MTMRYFTRLLKSFTVLFCGAALLPCRLSSADGCGAVVHSRASVDGVVLSEGGKKLLRVDPAQVGIVFEVPESVEFISANALSGCTRLETLKLARNVQGVDNIHSCPALQSFVVSPDNPYLSGRDGVLYNKAATKLLYAPFAYSREKLALPDGLREIVPGRFCNTKGLRVVRLPKSVEDIGQWCFGGDGDIREFEVEEGNPRYKACGGMLVDMQRGELVRCPPKLVSRELSIPGGVASIGMQAFSCCNDISAVVIPEGVTNVGRSAFGYCDKLEKVVVPASVERICDDSFRNCKSLCRIEVAPDNCNFKSADGSLYSRSGVLLRQSAAVENGCVRVPGFVERIGSFSFSGLDSVRKVIVPAGTSAVSYLAFFQCPNLKTIVCEGDCPRELEVAGMPKDCVVYADLRLKRWSIHAKYADGDGRINGMLVKPLGSYDGSERIR